MPTKPPTRCTIIDCHDMAVARGRCRVHQPTPWARPSKARAGLDETKWQRARKGQLRRTPYCESCGATHHLEVDHLLAIADGGALYDEENLQTLCHTCHGIKTTKENTERMRRAAVARKALADRDYGDDTPDT